jgi:hypothetical protein
MNCIDFARERTTQGNKGRAMKATELKERLALAWQIIRGRDGNLARHAMTELKAAGYGDGDTMNGEMARCIINLVRVFSSQGHSGFSAPFARDLFADLAAFKPLCPLTGADSEWFDHGEDMDETMRWQNKRAGNVFKSKDGSAYDIDAVVFEEPDGSRFTGRYSRMPVAFPYVPRSVVARLPENATDVQKETLAKQAWESETLQPC